MNLSTEDTEITEGSRLESTGDGRDQQTFAIIGAAIEVHRELGVGFLEPAYHEALRIEFGLPQLPFRQEVPLPILYKGEQLRCAYRADFVCYEDIIVELKALPSLTTREQAQLLNYLKATGFHRGLLLNFGGNRVESKRMVN
jgi:GxxExxY protein